MSKHGVLDQLAKLGFSSESLKQSVTRKLVWSRDASHFQIEPATTLRASNIQEVSRILEAASGTHTPVTFRSGGSSLSGQTLGRGLVVDTRSGFQAVVKMESTQVTAEPGVTLSRLNGHLLGAAKKVGPDPASLVASTLGGAVGNNSSGMTCGTKFNSYATIIGAKIVFADGLILDTLIPDAEKHLRTLKPKLVKELETIRDQIRADGSLSSEVTRLFTLKNTMGYSLNSFLDFENPLDILTHLMVGSEGTLGFLGEITMGLLPVKKVKATNLLIFESLEVANDSLMEIISQDPAAIELMDRTSLSALDSQELLPAEAIAVLGKNSTAVIVEFEAEAQEELAEAQKRFEKKFVKNLVFAGVTENSLRNRLWAMRKNLYAIVAKARPEGTTALLEDVAVPPEKLTIACKKLSELCEKHGYGTPVIFGHVRDGNIHFMISDDFATQERVKAFENFTADMVELILSLGGNLKAEHGTGRAMAPFVEAQFGKELFEMIKRVKKAFDPLGILNPGVIIAASDTEHLENLKITQQVDAIVDSCVECGYCESSCPSAGLTLTPRERIVAFRELSRQPAAVRKTLTKELHYQADQTCATDGMCQINCPVNINTGTFVKEIRAKNQTGFTQGLGKVAQKNWGTIASLAGRALRVAGLVPALAATGSKVLAAITPKGLTPIWSESIRAEGFRRSKLPSGQSKEFAYLPSCMNEVFGDSSVARVLELANQSGEPVFIPENLKGFCCGTPFSSKGLTEAYQDQKSKNQELLTSLSQKTLIIDGSSCHQTLSGQSDIRTIELSEFVAENLLDIPVKTRVETIILHPTCSGEATGANSAMVAIANRIADKVITPANWRCCGFAGDRGLLVPELTVNATSLEAEELVSVDALRVSNNQPCQIGMSGGTGKTYISILEAWVRSVS